MLKKFLSGIAILVAMCISLTSCNFNSKSEEVSAKTDTEKYNSYINLGNYMTGWVDEGMMMYFEEFGDKKEIRIRKGFNNFDILPVLQGHTKDVEKAFEYASKEPSYGPADASLKALYPKLKEFMDTINQVENYYKSKAFVDDKFAKGKELHKKICAQYNEYAVLEQKFFSDFSVITDKRRQADLDKLKENDMLIRYYALSIVMRAKDIEMDFYKAKVDDDNILDLNVNEYKKRYDLLTNDINKFMEYSKDPKRSKKESIGVIPTFADDIQRIKVSATDIMQILKTKNVNINSHNKGKVTTGGSDTPLSDFSRILSQLIDSYNNMININVVE